MELLTGRLDLAHSNLAKAHNVLRTSERNTLGASGLSKNFLAKKTLFVLTSILSIENHLLDSVVRCPGSIGWWGGILGQRHIRNLFINPKLGFSEPNIPIYRTCHELWITRGDL